MTSQTDCEPIQSVPCLLDYSHEFIKKQTNKQTPETEHGSENEEKKAHMDSDLGLVQSQNRSHMRLEVHLGSPSLRKIQ